MNDIVTSGDLLIVFTRFPLAGQAKTRLIPALGAEGAAELQRRMSEYIFSQCCELTAIRPVRIEVFCDGGTDNDIVRWLPDGMAYQRQHSGDLGQRIEHAFNYGFSAKMERIIVVGADCPFLTPAIMEEGFKCLRKTDIVLGPTHDGGFYLIGLTRHEISLWGNVEWGTQHVLRQTLKNAGKLALSHSLLTTLADIDRPADLVSYNLFLGQNRQSIEK